MRGWQQHHGKHLPRHIGPVKVMLRLRNGQTRGPARASLYGGWEWTGPERRPFEIVEYRVATVRDGK